MESRTVGMSGALFQQHRMYQDVSGCIDLISDALMSIMLQLMLPFRNINSAEFVYHDRKHQFLCSYFSLRHKNQKHSNIYNKIRLFISPPATLSGSRRHCNRVYNLAAVIPTYLPVPATLL